MRAVVGQLASAKTRMMLSALAPNSTTTAIAMMTKGSESITSIR